MQKNIAIIVLFILLGCTGPQHQTVMVNKTVKVFADGYHDQSENYTFKWNPPIGPNNKIVLFNLTNDMLIFTPDTIGNYEVSLTIEDIADQVVAKEIFYFNVIHDTSEDAVIEPREVSPRTTPSISEKKPEIQPAKKSEHRLSSNQNTRKSSKRKIQPQKTTITINEYAIQISAWPSLEDARKHQLELIDKGFDAYTQRFYLQKRDEVWYRVRIGNFLNRNKALDVKKQLESVTGITSWLAIVSTK